MSAGSDRFAEGVGFSAAVDEKAPDDDPFRPFLALDDDVQPAVRFEMGKNHPAEDGPVPFVVQGGLEVGKLDVPDGRGLGIFRHQGQQPVEQRFFLFAPSGEIGLAVKIIADDFREPAQVVFPVEVEDFPLPVARIGRRIGRLPFLVRPDGVESRKGDLIAFLETDAVLGEQPEKLRALGRIDRSGPKVGLEPA